jgi:thiol-disulfide isomerase/thioredoxin
MKINRVLINKFKSLIILVSLLALFVSMCQAGKCEKQIEDFTLGNERHCVLFHSTNCGWCKKMMPEWNKFSDSHSKQLKISKVEASEDPELISNLGINGFPTIMLFENGKHVNTHKGERTVVGFSEFIKN